ncbi:MAG: integration host factor alpha-subunit [Rickettsiaceae bacterium]|jgi:integration host factor subunit alpha|nr:integration host factor alpha-subunit [Rickettsiaceae bacterium]
MSQTITKAALSSKVSEKLGISQALCENVISSMFEGIIDLLDREKKLKLQNFGTFKIHAKKERFGLNISRMQPVTISSRRVINFLASKKLKAGVNS